MALAPSDKLPVSFNNAFERLRATINAEDARTFASTTMQDVWNAARRIERQLEAKRSLRNFNRIQKFLAGIEQYSKIVEVLCNQTPYLPFIWAPIKLFLEISQANLSALDKLIDAYSMIGEAMPRFDKLSAAFKDDQDFQQVLGQFYEDILEFHRRAYKFFRRRAWKIVFESLWKTFDSRFEFILENLKKHRDLVDQEVNAANIVEAKAWRIKQLEEVRRRRVERAEDLDRMERERMARQVREAAAWLGANQEQEDTLAKLLRAHDGMDSHWSLATPTILSWIEQGRENLFLWLNGKPGAGKSVICSKVIERIQEKTEMAVIFYFCHHFQTSKELTSEVLKSFTTQLLTANSVLAPYILDTFVNNGRKPTKKILAEILERLIASSGPIRFVVDGLDEWSQIDQEDLIKDLFRIRGPSPGACKILLSSRKTAHLTKLLQSEPAFRLEDYVENISSNIASFVHEPLKRLRHTFGPELIDELENEILKRADGMFLWVRLILYTLEGLYYESDVREAIKTLPNGLDALYERILLRICGNGRDPNQRRSVRILQWMLVAQRPLKRAELESGIILDDQVHQITLATKARGNVLSLCFPLIEVDEDPSGYVNFCHFTALEFLQKSNTYAALQPAQAHVTVSLSCVLYLASSFNFVDLSVAERDIRDQVIQGFHELLLYACDHWHDHLQALAARPTRLLADQCVLSSIQQGLDSLSQLHYKVAVAKSWTCGQQTDSFPSSRDDLWDSLGVSPSVRRLLNQGLVSTASVSAMARDRAGQHIPSDRDRHPTLFTKIRARYKSITEDILNLEDSAGALIREFRVGHSLGSYLCSYEGCPRASQGFSSLELRQQHEESHEPRFQCSNPACGFWKCSSEAALRKHTAKYHNGQDVSCVPHSFNSSFREVSQERSLFRLATPKRRSPVQEFPSNETFAGTRLSKSETPSETSPALLQRTDSPLEDEDVIPHLLGKQQHRVPGGWRTTVNQQERIANVNRIAISNLPTRPGAFPTFSVNEAVEVEVVALLRASDRDTYDAAIRKYLLDRQNISPSIGRNRAQGYPPLPTDILELSGYFGKRRREQIVGEYIDGDSQVEDAAVTPSGTPLYYERSGQRQQDLLQAMVDERRKNLPMLTSKRLDKVADSKPGIQLHNAIESRGCMTCRKRKKKCDEKHPECSNCLRGGFVCEGYTGLAKALLEQEKYLQPKVFAGSDLVDSAHTTPVVSAPAFSARDAIVSGAARTYPGLETSRQSHPSMGFEHMPYSSGGLSFTNPWNSGSSTHPALQSGFENYQRPPGPSPPLVDAGGVTDDGSPFFHSSFPASTPKYISEIHSGTVAQGADGYDSFEPSPSPLLDFDEYVQAMSRQNAEKGSQSASDPAISIDDWLREGQVRYTREEWP